ncbi:MAG TPA: aminoacyl--tRNA ligase-related protein [Candidatus Paceibacterota bacterium]|nr:aminoacyl--tRNA ligase-related protein [Candidatus Paceibacterota bacterium]
MRQSQLFTKTRREAPKDEVSKNAQLLIRAGYIHKEMAGVYSYLPLGLRVLNNLIGIIRKEMNAVDGQEVLMSSLQDPELWKQTDRWSDKNVDVWFKSEFKAGGEVGFGWTHEEDITSIANKFVSSYRDLPFSAYQFQTKFRNETRAKSGIMRTREFIMKDMYSFARSADEHEELYEKIASAYDRVYARAGIGEQTYRTFASGGAFSKYSHEYQTVCEAGEDVVYVHEGKRLAVNKEVLEDSVLADLGIKRDELVEKKAIEVGNIFSLGTRFSDALSLKFKEEGGEAKSVIMGCYGIGPGRLMGTIVETLADDKGIVWPAEVAPFRVHLIELSNGNEDVHREAEELYRELGQAGIEALWDDRDARAGEKLNDSDLIGIPLRVVVSEKTLAAGKFECTQRQDGKTEHRSISELLDYLSHA